MGCTLIEFCSLKEPETKDKAPDLFLADEGQALNQGLNIRLLAREKLDISAIGSKPTVDMGKRTDFGASWDEVVAKWYLGRLPKLAPERGWEALGTVERLYPERLDDALKPGLVGPATISYVVEMGLILAACEGLAGFAPVLQRVRSKDRAAMAELAFANTLVRLGYAPVLGPPVDGRRSSSARQANLKPQSPILSSPTGAST